jgi:hypothetical protein
VNRGFGERIGRDDFHLPFGLLSTRFASSHTISGPCPGASTGKAEIRELQLFALNSAR